MRAKSSRLTILNLVQRKVSPCVLILWYNVVSLIEGFQVKFVRCWSLTYLENNLFLFVFLRNRVGPVCFISFSAVHHIVHSIAV